MLFEELAELWLAYYKPFVKINTFTDTRNNIKNHLYPKFFNRNIDSIKTMEIADLIRSIHIKQSTNLALRTLGIVERMYEYAFIYEITLHDPTYRVKRFLGMKIKRDGKPFLRLHDLQRYIDCALRKPCKIEIGVVFITLAYTVVRLNELVQARVSDFDLIDGYWYIPAENTKMNREHVVIIPEQLKSLLKKYFDKHQSLWAFPNHKDHSKQTKKSTFWDRNNKGGRGRKMLYVHTPHAFRNTFSTHAYESGLWEDSWIETTLSHKLAGTKGIYCRSMFLEQRTRMMQWYANEIDKYVDFNVSDFLIKLDDWY